MVGSPPPRLGTRKGTGKRRATITGGLRCLFVGLGLVAGLLLAAQAAHAGPTLTATPQNGAVHLEWLLDEYDKFWSFYRVEYNKKGKSTVTVLDSKDYGFYYEASSWTIDGLQNHVTYQFKITRRGCAFGICGNAGGWSNVVEVKPGEEPSAPQQFYSNLPADADPANSVIVLSWDAPWNGGHQIRKYEVRHRVSTSSDWEETVTVTGQQPAPYRFDGLLPGLTYQFQARASNVIGTSNWSSTHEQATGGKKVSLPSAPHIFSTGGWVSPGAIRIQWAEPDNNGGSPLTDFDLRFRRMGAADWILREKIGLNFVDNVYRYDLSGADVDRGYDYEWQVRSHNAYLVSDWSTLGETNTRYDGQPHFRDTTVDDLVITVGDNFSETLPHATGEPTLTYVLAPDVTGIGLTFVPEQQTLYGTPERSHLPVTYTYTVTDGDAYTPETATLTFMITVRPEKPQALGAIPLEEKISLSWDDPADAGITGWELSVDENAWMPIATTAEAGSLYHTVTGLTNGTTYKFRVRAVVGSDTNAVYSEISDSLSVAPVGLPAQPGNLVASAADRQVVLKWTPGSDGGTPITKHEYRYKEAGGSYPDEWTLITDSAPDGANYESYTVTSLTNGTAYFFQVRAGNTIGEGAAAENEPTATPTESGSVPDAPAALTATAGRGEVTLNWTSGSGSDIIKHEYRQKEAGGSYPDEWTLITDSAPGGANYGSYTVTGLTNGTTYIFQVRAVNATGASDAASNEPTATPLTVPDAPSNLDVEAGNGQVTLGWSAASNDGGTAIIKHQYRQKEAGGGYPDQWTDITDSAPGGANYGSYTVTGLTNGTTYTFQVRVVNAVGASDAASNEDSATPGRPPDAPGNLTATAGNQNIAVSWTLGGDGGSPLVSHSIEWTSQTGVGWDQADTQSLGPTATSHMITSLTNGTTYRVRVRARSEAEIGVWSGIETLTPNPVFDAAVPDQEYTVGESGYLSLPAATGAGTLSYSLTPAASLPDGMTFDDQQLILSGAPTASQGWRTLTYTASETGGNGMNTLQFRLSAPPALPTLGGTPDDGELHLGWYISAADSGISGWQLSVDDLSVDGDGDFAAISEEAEQSGTRFTYTVPDLINGQEYSFRVRAVAGIGADTVVHSMESNTVTSVPLGVPAALDILVAIPGNGQVTLGWSAPVNDGGSPILRYAYQYKEKDGSYPPDQWTYISDSAPGEANENSYTVTGLTNGTTYVFRVRAENTVGGGEPLVEKEATTAQDTAPDFVEETLSDGEYIVGAAVDLTLPVALGGDGDLTYTLAPDLPKGLSFNAASRAVSGTPDTSRVAVAHSYTVADSDSNNTASDEATRTFSISVAPAKTAQPTATPGYEQALLTWTNPGDDGVTGWQMTLDDGVSWSDLTPDNDWQNGTFVEKTLTSLTNGTGYAVRVRAVATSGTDAVYGEASRPAEFTPTQTATVPGEPTELVATAGNTQATLSWTVGPDGGRPITMHEYQYREDGASYSDQWTAITDSVPGGANENSYTVTGLTNGTTYFFQVRAVNAVGASDASDEDSATPTQTATVPGEPTELVATAGNTQATLSWTVGPDGGRPITMHEYQYREDGASYSDQWTAITDSVPGGANENSYTVTGLTNGTTYFFQVRAVNAVGVSDASDEDSATPTQTTTVPGAPDLVISEQAVTVTEATDGQSVSYTVHLSDRPDVPVTVSLSSDDDSVATVAPETLNFAMDDWDSPKAVTVTGVDDAVDNDGRGTAIRHRASGGGYADASETVVEVTLVDDDSVTVSIAAVSAPEGDAGTSPWAFTVSLSIPSTAEIEIDWATADGTATAGDDYVPGSGTLRIAPGETSGRIEVAVHGDELPEGDEYFQVVLSAARGAELGASEARGTILEDDLGDVRGEAVEGMLGGLARAFGGDAVGTVAARLQGSLLGGGRSGAYRPQRAVPGEAGGHAFDSVMNATGVLPDTDGFGTHGAERWRSGDPSAADAGNQGGLTRLWSMLPHEFQTQVGAVCTEDGSDTCSGGLNVWGRVTMGRFDAGANGRDVGGELNTGYLGVDRHFRDNLLAGVALTHSLSDLDSRTDATGSAMEADASLTSVLPYGRLNIEGGSVWGLLGVGWGELKLADEYGKVETDLSLRLVGAGWRREMTQSGSGDLSLAVKGDAMASWLSADGVAGQLSDADADAQRVRLLLEARRDLSSSGTAATSVQLDAGARWDGGTTAGGAGIELNLSLAHRRPVTGLEIVVDGRYTLLHSADRFEESSLSLAMSLDPGARGLGPRLSLAPSWGGAGGGGVMSWLRADASISMAPGLEDDSSRLGWNPNAYQAELGYGWLGRRGQPLDVYSALERDHSGAAMRFGGRMVLNQRLDLLSLELMRTEQHGAPADHAIMLRFGSSMSAPGER